MLVIRLKVKFRAFLITFVEFDKRFEVRLPVTLPPMEAKTLYNDHGILLEVSA